LPVGSDYMDQQQYTRFVGEKFHEDGSVRAFPGNTVISKVMPDMPLYSGLMEAQKQLKAVGFSRKYAFLLPSSFHMTIMEGLCEQVRTPEQWSTKLALHLSMDEVNQFMRDCFARMSPPHMLTMRIVEGTFAQSLVFILEPADAETAQGLKGFREQFSRETGIRFSDHDTYTYHIALAYNLITLTALEDILIQKEQQEIQRALSVANPVIKLGKPRLTYFENMFQFDDMTTDTTPNQAGTQN
jgi:hypothetical protein